jgi:L-asparaginase
MVVLLGSDAAMAAREPDAGGDADLVLHALPEVSSASLSPAHLVDVAQRIEDALASGCDGAVVVQGPDTIEEAAFVLDLLVGSAKPVVVTAAASLRAATLVAGCGEAQGLGTLVLADDAIHAARFAQRIRTGASPEFQSPLVGPLGTVVEGRARIWARVPRLPVLPAHGGPPRPVVLLSWAMGEDGRRLGPLPALGYAGAVVESMGAGHVPIEAVPRLRELAARIPVVLASRSLQGVVVAGDGGGQGAEGLLARGLIPAGSLSGLKARLLLGLALRGGAGRAAAAAAFAPYQ